MCDHEGRDVCVYVYPDKMLSVLGMWHFSIIRFTSCNYSLACVCNKLLTV